MGTAAADFFDINDLLASSSQQNAQPQPREQEEPSDTDSGPCWGALLTGGDLCTPGFKIGRLHFKNKYCDNVRDAAPPPSTLLTSRRPLTEPPTPTPRLPPCPPPPARSRAPRPPAAPDIRYPSPPNPPPPPKHGVHARPPPLLTVPREYHGAALPGPRPHDRAGEG
jgi:hypothetical protein